MCWTKLQILSWINRCKFFSVLIVSKFAILRWGSKELFPWSHSHCWIFSLIDWQHEFTSLIKVSSQWTTRECNDQCPFASKRNYINVNLIAVAVAIVCGPSANSAIRNLIIPVTWSALQKGAVLMLVKRWNIIGKAPRLSGTERCIVRCGFSLLWSETNTRWSLTVVLHTELGRSWRIASPWHLIGNQEKRLLQNTSSNKWAIRTCTCRWTAHRHGRGCSFQ